jgi:uncharacterized membrane protein
MLLTVVLLVLCVVMAFTGIPLILKLVPPNPVFGLRTERTMARADAWYRLHRFGGWALVAVAAGTVIALSLWSGTLLRPAWLQLLVFILLSGFAAGATLWYERQLGRRGKSRRRAPAT